MDIVNEVCIEARDVEPVTAVLPSDFSLLNCLLDECVRRLQFFLFGCDLLVQVLHLQILLPDIFECLFAFKLLLRQELLLLFKLLSDAGQLIGGLLDFLRGSSCHDLRIFKVCLQLIVSRLQRRDLLELLCLSSSLLLLLFSELVQELGVARLGHSWVGRDHI